MDPSPFHQSDATQPRSHPQGYVVLTHQTCEHSLSREAERFVIESVSSDLSAGAHGECRICVSSNWLKARLPEVRNLVLKALLTHTCDIQTGLVSHHTTPTNTSRPHPSRLYTCIHAYPCSSVAPHRSSDPGGPTRRKSTSTLGSSC